MSANTRSAPTRANASAVETKVKLGTITSSPGPTSVSNAASSSVLRAGGGEDYLPSLEPFIEESAHTLCEGPARRCVAATDGLTNVIEFLTFQGCLVETDCIASHSVDGSSIAAINLLQASGGPH